MLGWKRRFAAASMAVGCIATSASPVMAMTPTAAGGEKCVEYGKVAHAPKGTIPRDDMHTVHRDALQEWAQAHPARFRAAANAETTVTVPVVFHVIRKNNTLAGGNLPDSQIQAQMRVLNEGYEGTGFRFVLKKVTRTTDAGLFLQIPTEGGEPRFHRGSSKEVRMKRLLHTGDARTMNVYSAALGKFLLGWAYFPTSFTDEEGQPLPEYFDGVVIDYRSVPGGSFSIYNEGDTLTHEAGHWMNLFHTFSNGCERPGDRVKDTPYEASPAFYCPEGRDSCVDKPGLDPIRNFMDYTQDSCMNTFTDGQADRMRQSWEAYRASGDFPTG